MAAPQAGPFKAKQFVANGILSTKSAVLANYSVQNKSAGAIDVFFYDDPTGGTANPIEAMTVAANQAQAVYPLARTENGLSIQCSNWTSVIVSARYVEK